MKPPSKRAGGDNIILESIRWNTVENSYQFDEIIQLLKDSIAATARQTELLSNISTALFSSTVTDISQQKIPPVNSVNLQVYEAERPSPKLQHAIDWLAANPNRANETSRVLAAEIGVSHMTVAKAQTLIKAGSI